MTDANLVVAIGRWRREELAEAYRRHGLFLVNLEGALVLSRARHDATPLRRAGAVVAAAVDAELPRPARRRRSQRN